MVNDNEKQILRELGANYMEAAATLAMREKMELWRALNRKKMQRPMVCMDQLPWNEIIVPELECKVSDPFWQGVEWDLRESLYRFKHFPVDMVLEPWINIPMSIGYSGYGLGSKVTHLGLSQSMEAVISDFSDIEKIKEGHVVYNKAETERHMEEARLIFDTVASVHAKSYMSFHLGAWDTLTYFMGGVTNIYMDFYERPEFLHAAMQRMTDSLIAGIKSGNELKVHADELNLCHCSYTYTDDLLPDFGKGKGGLSQNSWAFGLAQLFTDVAPEMFNEFEIPYIKQTAQYFGKIYYGCCDRLDDRLEYVKTIPNVQKISCSPWSVRESFAEKIGKDYIMSNKPTPALLAGDSFDEEAVRSDLKRTCDLAKKNNINLEMILKDVSTIQNDPSRLDRWAAIAMETVESF